DYCFGPTGYHHDSVTCGRANSKPRPLVRSVKTDNGVVRDGATFRQTTLYDYENGRVASTGSPSNRTNLGFALVTKTNAETGAFTRHWYRQDWPFNYLTDNVAVY